MSSQGSRRDFVKKAAYVAPVVLTLGVRPAYARSGSAGPERGDCGDSRRGGGSHSGGHRRGRGYFGFFHRVAHIFRD